MDALLTVILPLILFTLGAAVVFATTRYVWQSIEPPPEFKNGLVIFAIVGLVLMVTGYGTPMHFRYKDLEFRVHMAEERASEAQAAATGAFEAAAEARSQARESIEVAQSMAHEVEEGRQALAAAQAQLDSARVEFVNSAEIVQRAEPSLASAEDLNNELNDWRTRLDSLETQVDHSMNLYTKLGQTMGELTDALGQIELTEDPSQPGINWLAIPTDSREVWMESVDPPLEFYWQQFIEGQTQPPG